MRQPARANQRGEWEVDTQVGSWQTRKAEEDGYDTFTKQVVECVFDQIFLSLAALVLGYKSINVSMYRVPVPTFNDTFV